MNCQMLSKYPLTNASDWSILSPNSPVIGQFTDDSSWPHNTHRVHHHIPGWENTTKHDNGASQNSFMQRGFSRCWDLLSSVTTRLLRSEILSTVQAPAPAIWPWGPALFLRTLWIILDNNDLDLVMNGTQGSAGSHVLDLALFSSAANFSLGPGISSNISKQSVMVKYFTMRKCWWWWPGPGWHGGHLGCR